jgi:precorrin-4/cobalt-precorrin-4 C11-methyltransferase
MTLSNKTEGANGQVWFVGAGPGDPELITVKGQRLLQLAGAVLYAGSLVNEAATLYAPASCLIRDSKDMTLEEITGWLIEQARQHKTVVRLQTGDPGLYGALVEMVQPLDAAGIPWAVVPGVSSAMASAAAAGETLTLPEITQTVIFTRVAGRTPMPAGEELESLASHHTTLCIFLSITLLSDVQQALLAAGWAEEAPILVVQKASWPNEEKIVRGTLKDIREKCRAEKINSQAMIIASPAMGARHWPEIQHSKLYDAGFSHRFRKAVKS